MIPLITQDEIKEAFENSHESEWPILAKRVMRYNETVFAERRENIRTENAVKEAIGEAYDAAWRFNYFTADFIGKDIFS
jgi:hypothetical protein